MAVEAYPAFLQNETFSAAITRRSENFLLQRGTTVGSTAGGVNGVTDLQVAAQVSPNMSVTINVGEANVPGTSSSTQSGYYLFNNAATTVAVATSSGSNPRIDLACATVGDSSFGGSDGGSLQVITGIAAGSPVAPSLPGTSTPLADILVPQSTSSIISSDVTDARLFIYFGAAGIFNRRVVSGTGGIAAASGDLISVSSGATPITAPVPFVNARFGIVNKGGGAVTFTQHGSEAFFFPGSGSTGASGGSVAAVGANIYFQFDGTAWVITAGNADSGWVRLSALTFHNSWADAGGPVSNGACYRLTGNIVRLAGGVSSGAGGNSFTTNPLPAAYRPTYALQLSTGNQNQDAALIQVTTGGVLTPFWAAGAPPILLDGLTWTVD